MMNLSAMSDVKMKLQFYLYYSILATLVIYSSVGWIILSPQHCKKFVYFVYLNPEDMKNNLNCNCVVLSVSACTENTWCPTIDYLFSVRYEINHKLIGTFGAFLAQIRNPEVP